MQPHSLMSGKNIKPARHHCTPIDVEQDHQDSLPSLLKRPGHVRAPIHIMARTMLSVVQEAEALFNARNTFVIPPPEEEDPDDTVAFFIDLARQYHVLGRSPRGSIETLPNRTGRKHTHPPPRPSSSWRNTRVDTSRSTSSIVDKSSRTAIAKRKHPAQQSRVPKRHSIRANPQAAKQYTDLPHTPQRCEHPRRRKGVKPQRTKQETEHECRHGRHDHPAPAMSILRHRPTTRVGQAAK